MARAIARGVARAGRELILVGLASTEPMRRAAQAEGLRVAAEAFADRRYTPAGTLQSRREPGSVLSDSAEAAAQAVKIATEGRVTATDGSEIALQAETLCLHGDNPAAVAHAAVRRALESAGVAVQPRRVSGPGAADPPRGDAVHRRASRTLTSTHACALLDEALRIRSTGLPESVPAYASPLCVLIPRAPLRSTRARRSSASSTFPRAPSRGRATSCPCATAARTARPGRGRSRAA